jgi:N-methylhydantoinase B
MPQQAAHHFEHGEARSRFEMLWTPQRYQLLTAFLASAPVSWRHFLKTQVFRAVAEIGETADMAQIFSDLRQRYPAMANN